MSVIDAIVTALAFLGAATLACTLAVAIIAIRCLRGHDIQDGWQL